MAVIDLNLLDGVNIYVLGMRKSHLPTQALASADPAE